MPKCKTGKYILSFGQPNLPTCSMASTYLFFHLLSKPSLHLIAKMILGIITILFTTAISIYKFSKLLQLVSINFIVHSLSMFHFFFLNNCISVTQDCKHFIYQILNPGITYPIQIPQHPGSGIISIPSR